MPENMVEVQDLNIILDGGFGLPITLRPGDREIHDVEELVIALADGREYRIRQAKVLYIERMPVRLEPKATTGSTLPTKLVDTMNRSGKR